MKNFTNVKVPKKYQPFIYSISREDELEYVLELEEAATMGEYGHTFNFDTQAELLSAIRDLSIIEPDKYISAYGTDEIEEYKKSYISITGKHPAI